MIRYFASHPTLSNILMMAIIAIGLYSLGGLNKESFPQVKLSKVQVQVAYPGAAPSDVADGICNPLENATDGISFLKEQVCDARDNVAIFTLEMQEDGDIRQFTDDIKTEIDAIRNFPDNAEDPVIKQLGRTNPIADIAITSEKLTLTELKALTEYYRDRLIAMPQIPVVIIDGFSTHQLQILIHPDTQQKYNLSVQDIANLIAAQALELPAGTLESTAVSYQIQFDNARKTATELADLTILNTNKGAEIKLGDIASIRDTFENPEDRIELDGTPTALLRISKNINDDTLAVADALFAFVERENQILPSGTRLTIINDTSTLVRDRLQLLLKNGWQGLILATLMLLLFFSWRYTFWIALGLPISFVGGLALMVVFGVSINMLSMVALLIAIGILMDDAIVLSENIDNEYRQGQSPLEAAVNGSKKVFRGVFSSFLTSAFLFGSLLMMEGELGQRLGVIPIVLLSVLTISLIEAFLILPHHLKHSLEHSHHKAPPKWRQYFEARFDQFRHKVADVAMLAMQFRYVTVGLALAMLILSIGLIATGIIKFTAFPTIQGNVVEARVLMPQGTPLAETEQVVKTLLTGLHKSDQNLSQNESSALVKNILISYGQHTSVPENGSHLATINVNLLETENRITSITELIRQWKQNIGPLPNALSIQYQEPMIGPSGRAIHIRLSGADTNVLSQASWDLQNWLRGYDGVSNLLDDLRPGKPQYRIRLKPGALATGIDSRSIASQLRSAYLEVKISEIYSAGEAYEIVAKLDSRKGRELHDFDNFNVFSKTGQAIPLSRIASVTEDRQFSRIERINHQRTVNVYGDIDANISNTAAVITSLQNNFLSTLQQRYPNISFTFKGEVENGAETRLSILSGFGLGAIAVFLLLSLQFRNYREPLIVMVNIPLALIGTIWGHLIMGLDMTLPSMIGFVSLAGIVVNDSILLVEFIKYRIAEGMALYDATRQAVYDRFRAIFLTSITTVAGMTPLLFESSTQALILIPLVTSIVFGMLASTVLIMLVLPALYAIMEDLGFVRLTTETGAQQAIE